MERDAELAGIGAHQAQQRDGVFVRSAELARQIVQGFARGRGDAHDEVQRAGLGGRFFAQLVELGARIDHETAHRMTAIGLADRRARAHRMHVGDGCRTPEHRAHKRDFGGRRAVETAHAAVPQRAQDARVGIAFDGIERFAGKPCDKMRRRACQRLRANRMHGFVRAQFFHDRIERAQDRRFERPGQSGNGFAQRGLCHRSSSATKASAKRRRNGDASGIGGLAPRSMAVEIPVPFATAPTLTVGSSERTRDVVA